MKRIVLTACWMVMAMGEVAGAEPAMTSEAIRGAVSRAMPLLEQSAREFTKQRECFSCHHQTLPVLAFKQAQRTGIPSHLDELKYQVEWTANFLDRNQARFREGKGTGGQADTAGYALWALAAADYPPDPITDAVAEYLLLRHQDRDHWSATSQRPPTEASDFTTTFLAIQGLNRFAGCEQRERANQRKDQARKWLVSTAAKDTEDSVFRLRALKVADADVDEIKKSVDELLARQQNDGGWAQRNEDAGDAYATASSLAALVEAGSLLTSDDNYQRGLLFLLAAQSEDGSWHVSTRSKPIQEYFESGFPHGADQFISISATAWSVVALSLALPDVKPCDE